MKGFGGGGGMQQLMRQANQMQNKMKKKQEEIAAMEFEGTSGGGAVTCKVNGNSEVMDIQINPEVVSSDDLEMLQDLILTASNDALSKAKKTKDDEMSKITGGMGGLPGMF